MTDARDSVALPNHVSPLFAPTLYATGVPGVTVQTFVANAPPPPPPPPLVSSSVQPPSPPPPHAYTVTEVTPAGGVHVDAPAAVMVVEPLVPATLMERSAGWMATVTTSAFAVAESVTVGAIALEYVTVASGRYAAAAAAVVEYTGM